MADPTIAGPQESGYNPKGTGTKEMETEDTDRQRTRPARCLLEGGGVYLL